MKCDHVGGVYKWSVKTSWLCIISENTQPGSMWVCEYAPRENEPVRVQRLFCVTRPRGPSWNIVRSQTVDLSDSFLLYFNTTGIGYWNFEKLNQGGHWMSTNKSLALGLFRRIKTSGSWPQVIHRGNDHPSFIPFLYLGVAWPVILTGILQVSALNCYRQIYRWTRNTCTRHHCPICISLIIPQDCFVPFYDQKYANVWSLFRLRSGPYIPEASSWRSVRAPVVHLPLHCWQGYQFSARVPTGVNCPGLRHSWCCLECTVTGYG